MQGQNVDECILQKERREKEDGGMEVVYLYRSQEGCCVIEEISRVTSKRDGMECGKAYGLHPTVF